MLSIVAANLVRDPMIFCYFRRKDVCKIEFYLRKLVAYSTVELPNKDVISSRSRDDEDWKDKIIYNEVLHVEKRAERIKIENEKFKYKQQLLDSNKQPMVKPLFLQCMTDNDKEEVKIENDLKTSPTVQFPYNIQNSVLIEENNPEETVKVVTDDVKISESVTYDTHLKRYIKCGIEYENPRVWETKKDKETIIDSEYGSCDPNIPASNVPCGGCGALLHCKDTAIPGFLPKEIFKDLSESELRGITCQRCLFLQEYNIALGINVNPDEYPRIVRQIRNKKGLVILMVDLLDFPCSIWPDIFTVIGRNRPVFVVGNKIDLIIQEEGENFIQHRKNCLIDVLENMGLNSDDIKHVALISAKTGYGVEKLITALHNEWGYEGDIYIVGCTNVGKSTFFNTLIQSDFCKSKASDVLQRATVSQWPGTTLNLLKFPILKPLAWRRVLRAQRLKVTEKQMKALREIETRFLRKRIIHSQTSLKGYIGRSFARTGPVSHTIGLDPSDPEFINSKWCYDTPGVMHESQILNLFTTEELAKVLPRKTIIPRNFKLITGNALFIGGIARLDVISCPAFIWFTVFASADLPVTVTDVKNADMIYEKLLGTNMFSVPEGGEERLKEWPKFKSKCIKIDGKYPGVAAADVVLSSAGWIAITLPPTRTCELRAWTPDCRGIYVRDIPFVKYSSSYRGKKISNTPAYYPNIEIVDKIEFVK